MLDVTYSLEDNKLRIYLTKRLDKELWNTLRSAGYRWAPRQDLLYATWTPRREDFALAVAGEGGIALESTSVEERAEERARRFAEYSHNAGQRAKAARDRVKAICDRIPFGQPILIGHYSEPSARADQRRIENGQRKAVKEWAKEGYWQSRSKAVLSYAERLKNPYVVYRRLAKLRGELAKHQEAFASLYWDSETNQAVYVGKDSLMAHPQELAKRTQEGVERYCDFHIRWVENILARIAYNDAVYKASGGILADGLEIKVGDMILSWRGWCEVLRINKKRSGGISSYSVSSGYSWTDKIPPDKIQGHRPSD